jgi:uncharacterized protein YjiK
VALFLVLLCGCVGLALADLAIVQSWPHSTFPGGIAYDGERNHVWVVDETDGDITEYTRDGVFVSSFLASPLGLMQPIGAGWASDSGNLWICDEYTPEQVVESTRAGAWVSGFSVDAYVQDASGLAIDVSTGLIYVADDNAHEVVIFDTAGNFIGRWSSLPCSDTDSITYVACTNTLMVGDDTADTVFEFTLTGTLIQSWNLSTLLGIDGVEGLAADEGAATLFVSSGVTDTIYEISGIWGPSPVNDSSWGSIKAMYR